MPVVIGQLSTPIIPKNVSMARAFDSSFLGVRPSGRIIVFRYLREFSISIISIQVDFNCGVKERAKARTPKK